MKRISVVEYLGTPCLLAPEKGASLASELKKQVKSDSRVQADFKDYEFLSSAFLNHAFGQICIDLGWDQKGFSEHVIITGMDEDDVEELELAIDNAQTRRLLISKGQSPDQYYSSRLPA